MTPASAKASYARQVAASGDTVTIRRGGTDFGPIRARITGYMPEELIGSMQEGDRKVIMLADDVAASGLSGSIQARQDRMVLAGRALVIQSVDDTTRRVAGVVIAYELRVSGN